MNFNRKNKYKNNKKQRRSRIANLSRSISYQYKSGIQTLGPGFLIKNYETEISFNSSTMSTFTLDAMLGSQWQKDYASFTYFKILAFSILQPPMNRVDISGNIYVLFNFNRSIDGDITTNDSSKILPPFGKKLFIYKPAASIVYVTKTLNDDTSNRPLNLSVYNPTTNVLIDGVYHLPGKLVGYNNTNYARTVRVVLRVAYRGSLESTGTKLLPESDMEKKFLDIMEKGVMLQKLVPKKSMLERVIHGKEELLKEDL